MCNFLAGFVFKDKVYLSKNTNSHTEIIKENFNPIWNKLRKIDHLSDFYSEIEKIDIICNNIIPFEFSPQTFYKTEAEFNKNMKIDNWQIYWDFSYSAQKRLHQTYIEKTLNTKVITACKKFLNTNFKDNFFQNSDTLISLDSKKRINWKTQKNNIFIKTCELHDCHLYHGHIIAPSVYNSSLENCNVLSKIIANTQFYSSWLTLLNGSFLDVCNCYFYRTNISDNKSTQPLSIRHSQMNLDKNIEVENISFDHCYFPYVNFSAIKNWKFNNCIFCTTKNKKKDFKPYASDNAMVILKTESEII